MFAKKEGNLRLQQVRWAVQALPNRQPQPKPGQGAEKQTKKQLNFFFFASTSTFLEYFYDFHAIFIDFLDFASK